MKTLSPARQKHIESVQNVLYQLNDAEYAFFCNGAGSMEPIIKWFRPPEYVRLAIRPASDIHDVGYFMGGNGWHKNTLDDHFDLFSDRIADTIKSPLDKEWLGAWNKINSLCIALGGDYSFERRDQPLDYNDLIKTYKNRIKY